MKTVRILLVEDVADNRALARELLELAGHTVEEATNGGEVLQRARECRPDVILLDMSLPVVDGWEVLRRLRADPELARLPVIAVTAFAMAGDRERILLAGADGYISKPVSVSQFAAQIAACLIDDEERASAPPCR